MFSSSSSSSSTASGNPDLRSLPEESIWTTRKCETLSPKNVQRADYEDVPALKKLITADTMLLFNSEDVLEKIHSSAVSFLVKNKEGKTVAGICMTDYPNIPALPSDDWVTWVRRLYGIHELTGYNTFWVHLIVYDEFYEDSFMEAIFQFFFPRSIKDYVLIVVPPNYNNKIGFLKDISTMIIPNDCKNPNKVQTLRMLRRQTFSLSYKVRRAVEEDNDDLIPLINCYSTRLKDLYGEFYIAEIITRHPNSGRQIIVAEHKGLAVSVLCLNENVNYEDLNQSFDLHVFTGLFKSKSYRPKSSQSYDLNIASLNTLFELNFEDLNESHAIRIYTDRPRHYRHQSRSRSHSDYSVNTLKNTAVFDEVPKYTRPSQVDELSEKSMNSILSLSFIEIPTEIEKPSRVRVTVEENEEHVPDKPEIDFFQMDLFGTDAASEDSSLVSNVVMHTVQGVDNAFVVEIAAALPDHEYSLKLLLEAAFECYPEKEYCILTVPTNKPYFPFLREFVRVAPRRTALHPHDLYLVHKIVLNPVSVRYASEEDLEIVRQFADTIEIRGNLVEKFEKSIGDPNSTLKTFLLISAHKVNQPLGVVMVNEITDLDQLKVTYNIQSWHDMRREKNENVGVIEYFGMSPLFRKHTRFFMREIHRMSSYLTLFYAMNRFDMSPHRTRPLPTVLSHLFPVKPRRNVIPGKGGTLPCKEPFTLFIAAPRLTGVRRFQVNTRIVVVGASRTAIAFLESMLFSDVNKKCFTTFNNVTLISKHGMPHTKPPKKFVEHMRSKDTVYDFEYTERLNLKTYVNIISAVVTGIDRNEKTITLNKTQVLPYDLLFLMCGTQYNVPRKLEVKDYLNVTLYPNMFTINTDIDAELALASLTALIENHGATDEEYTIVIYGYTIDTYCCITALLDYGIKPERLTLIDQFTVQEEKPNHDFIFQDGEIYNTVMRYLVSAGVTVLSGYKLIDWWPSNEEPYVIMQFESHLRFLELEVLATFLYPEKSVNVDVWRAIIDAGLVFDGRLVVTPDCKTNDPCIYAAGKLTKYPRRYMAEHLAHRYFNPEEIGEALGKQIRAILIPDEPNVIPKNDIREIFGKTCWTGVENVLPAYEKPLITYCKFHPHLYYLKVKKPGKPIPREVQMADEHFGSVLGTGNSRNLKHQGYFRVHINTNKVIDNLVCCSNNPFDYKKLVLLWGKHETLLNNLMKRFEFAYVSDLFAFFEAPWATAIYHDDFALFEKEMMRIMMSQSVEENISPIEDLFRIYDDTPPKRLSSVLNTALTKKFKNSPYEGKIKKRLMAFIRDNIDSLDMYAHPLLIKAIMSTYPESFLFKDL